MEETESEEETISETDLDFTEDVNALVAGEELSEEFRLKAATIFEAAVTSRVNKEAAALQEAYESALTEEVEKIQTDLAEKVDDYLTYAAEQWMKENALQIEHGIKTEMAESFFNGLKGLFLEHNFSVPEEKFNLLDGMAGELDDMEAKLNEQIDANVALNKRIGEFVKMEIVNECATGLAETQKEKLASLAEGVEFETEEDFRNKVNTIKESYFTRKAEVAAATEPTEEASEPLVEETTSGTMSKYVDAIARWSK
jgi:antitoxin component of MazEF toxin-antitoxin module